MSDKKHNLPPHLQERRDLIVKSYCTPILETDEFTGEPVFRYKQIDTAVSYGYRQAYADILQELGPVVEAIEFSASEDMWVSDCKYEESFKYQYKDWYQDILKDALKHLKERILNDTK